MHLSYKCSSICNKSVVIVPRSLKLYLSWCDNCQHAIRGCQKPVFDDDKCSKLLHGKLTLNTDPSLSRVRMILVLVDRVWGDFFWLWNPIPISAHWVQVVIAHHCLLSKPRSNSRWRPLYNDNYLDLLANNIGRKSVVGYVHWPWDPILIPVEQLGALRHIC